MNRLPCIALFLVGCAQPLLDSVELDQPPATAREGTRISMRALGTNAEGEKLTLQVFGVPELTQKPRLIDTQSARFNGQGIAEFSWTVGGEILLFEGRNQVFFKAVLDDQVLQTESVEVPIVPTLQSISLRYQSPFGFETLPAGAAFPLGAAIEVSVQVQDMRARKTLSLEVRRSGTDELFDTLEAELSEGENRFVYQLDADRFAGQGDVRIFFRARSRNLSLNSVAVVAQPRGLHGCHWYGPQGDLLADRFELDTGLMVQMRVSVWGLEGASAILELWEDDDSNDDFVGRFTRTVTEGEATGDWVTEFQDDGLFNSTNEYYFTVDVGGFQCQSQILEVRE